MKKKINKYDMGLIAGIIIINVLLIVYGGSQFVKSNNKTAYIYSENRLVREYVITDDIADEITIESETGGYNRLRIEGGQIWIQDASCPDKICMYQGKISRNGEMITCLPNGLFIKIVDESDESGIDFIAE